MQVEKDQNKWQGGAAFHCFLDHLKKEGFEVSISHYIQLNRLLNGIDAHTCTFENLKYLLSPLVVKSREQQERFAGLYDEYFALFSAELPDLKHLPGQEVAVQEGHKMSGSEGKRRRRKWLPWAFAMGFLIISVLVYQFLVPSTTSIDSNAQDMNGLLDQVTLQLPDSVKAQIDVARQHLQQGDSGAAQTVIHEVLTNYENLAASRQDKDLLSSLNALEEQLVSQMGSIKSGASTKPGFSQSELIYFMAMLTVAFVFIYEYRLRINQVIAAELEFGKKPPYIWEINLLHSSKVLLDKTFYLVANSLRQRVATDQFDFELEGTVRQTVENGGLAALQYKQRTKPAEYLILIDKTSKKSHQAGFFSFLAKELSKNDVHVEEYYFQHDLLTFTNTLNPKLILKPQELIKLFPKHRVIILSNFHCAINPISGKIKEHVLFMNAWEDRIILTPQSSVEWDYKEVLLARFFTVLPANSEGFLALIDYFENAKTDHSMSWRAEHSEAKLEIPENPEIAIDYLKYHLNSSVYRWLCVCAVFPQLFWDLTIYLGNELFPAESVVSQKNIQELLRVSWFEEGYIPDRYRRLLKAQLSTDQLSEVRTAIVAQMRKNPPKTGTYAYDEFKLNLLTNQLLIEGQSEPEKTALRKELKKMYREADLSFYTEVKTQDAPTEKNWTSFLLPTDLERFFKDTTWKRSLYRIAMMAICFVIVMKFGSTTIYQFLVNNLSGTAVFLIFIVAYFIVFYRFTRPYCTLNSFEIAFSWLLLNLGLFLYAITSDLRIFESLNVEVGKDASISFTYFIISVPLTIILILNQLKRPFLKVAVAIYWVYLAMTFLMLSIIFLSAIFESQQADISNWALIFNLLLTTSFIFYRYKTGKLGDYELAVYYLVLYFPNVVIWDILNMPEGEFLFIIIFFVIAFRYGFVRFLRSNLLSIYLLVLGIHLAFTFRNAGDIMILLFLFVAFVLVLSIIDSNSREVHFKTTLYLLLFFVVGSRLETVDVDIIGGIGQNDKILLLGLMITIFLIFILIKRKIAIHAMELVLIWLGFAIMYPVYLGKVGLSQFSAIPIILGMATFFAFWKIRAN